MPPTIIEPRPQPRGSPLSVGGYRKGTAQRKEQPEAETPSLGSWSINDTPKKSPSDLAWESFRNCPAAIKSKYGKLLSDFCEYMQMCDNSGFRAEGLAMDTPCIPYVKSHEVVDWKTGYVGYETPPQSKNDFGKRTITGPLLNRWHPKRRTGWIARIYKLGDWYEANRIEGCTMISLTGYQDELSWYDVLDNINESRVKLLKILRKYLGKVSYFWVVEPHTTNDTGYPHIHLVVFRYIDNYIRDNSEHVGLVKCESRRDEAIWEIVDGEGMEDKLRRLYSEEWGTGSHTYGLDFQQMKGDEKIDDLKNYLMKYISKGYINDVPWSSGELVFNAHLYGATHGNRLPKEGEEPDFQGKYSKKYRIINMSRDLSELLKPEHEDKETIVWLHTDETEQTEIKNDDGTITTEERRKILYHRELIPDWLDSPYYSKHYDEGRYLLSRFFKWVGDPFDNLVNYDPFESSDLTSCSWGRPTTRYTGYNEIKIPTKEDGLTLRQRLKLARDGYL